MEVVHHEAANPQIQSEPHLLRRLVIAVKVHFPHREPGGPGYSQLAARDHIQPQALLFEYLGQRPIDEGLAGIGHLAIRVAASEFADELTTLRTQSDLIEEIEGRTEACRQPHRIAPTDREMTAAVHSGSLRKYVRVHYCLTNTAYCLRQRAQKAIQIIRHEAGMRKLRDAAAAKSREA